MRFPRPAAAIIVVVTLVLALPVVGSAAGSAPQSTADLVAVADSTVKSWAPDTNYGHDDYVELSYSTFDVPREAIGLLRFDLASALPSNAVIDSAILRLFLEDTAGASSVDVAAHFVTSAWSETSVTWNTFPTADPMGILSTIDDVPGSYKTWNVTSFARSWQSAANYGLYLRGPTDGTFFRRAFESRDFDESVPRLQVTYHIPVPTPTTTPDCADTAYEPNDSFGEAAAITPGAEFSAFICPAGDEDYFGFSATSGQAITVALRGDVEDLPGDYDLELYDPDEALAGFSNNGGTLPERIVQRADQTGTWYVRVYGFGGAFSPMDPYLLQVTVGDLPTPTNTATPPATDTPTSTPTSSATATWTPSSTASVTSTATASPGTPTSTFTATAIPPSPTATPTATPTPTASPTATPTGPTGCRELLDNGHFEAGDMSPWVSSGAVGLGPGRNTEYAVWLLGDSDVNAGIRQELLLPGQATSAEFGFWWMVQGDGDQLAATLTVRIIHDGGLTTAARVFRAESPAGRWRYDSLDLAAYAGRLEAVAFEARGDPAVPVTFWLDDMSLQTCGPGLGSQPWEFEGGLVGDDGEPLSGVEVRLLGSFETGEPGQLLDWTASAEDGSYLLRHEVPEAGAKPFPYLQVAVVDPGVKVTGAVSGSGGEAKGEGWLEFGDIKPGRYRDNRFDARRLQPAPGPAPLNVCADADAWVGDDDVNANHGADARLRVGYSPAVGASAYRSLVRFDLKWLQESGAKVAAAALQAYQTGTGGVAGRATVDVGVTAIKGQWTEGTVNWKNQPAVSAAAITATLDSGFGYRSWDVAQSVNAWLAGTAANDGLELRGPEVPPSWLREFESRDGSHPPRLALRLAATPQPAPAGGSSGHFTIVGPFLKVTPDWGEAGASFWVNGFNLDASRTYQVYWDLPEAANKLAEVTPTTLGVFGVPVKVPASAEAGTHVVSLYYQDPIEHVSELLASARFTVLPACVNRAPPPEVAPKIILSTTQGPSNGGNTVQAKGSGWYPGTTVRLFFHNASLCFARPGGPYCLGQVTADAQGKFLTSFTVPPIAGAGEHVVIAANYPRVAPLQTANALYRMVAPPSPPTGDTQGPSVFAQHSLKEQYPGGPVAVSFEATAWDLATTPSAYNGIVRVELWARAFGVPGGVSYTPIHKTCKITGWVSSLSCWERTGGVWSAQIPGFYYWAQAEDRSGNVTTAPVKFAWLVNEGLDSDSDGLSDAVESIVCTDPNNPDTDRDNLLDGWEVEGHRFPDGHFVDLPSMGAHPCVQDVFVEIDWRRSRNRPNPATELQPVVNAFKDHGVQLHIDYGQWGGGEDIGTATSPHRKYFDPHRLWSFHYTIFEDGGGVCWRGKVAQVGRSDRAQTFMHELGHCNGLGHGGSKGPNTEKRSGSWVWYDQDYVDTNNKPNYLSLMNYAWNGLVFVPGTGFRFVFDFSEKALPELDEKSLDERATSAFAQALRAYPLPSGVPANGRVITMYSCKDPDEKNQIFIVATDGRRPVGRVKVPDPWQFTNLPAQDKDGIDWDCDGKIEEKVKTNINGKSGQGFLFHEPWTADEKLTSTDDWSRIPAVDPCIGDEHAFGKAYLKAAHNPPCESRGWSPASLTHDHSPKAVVVPPGEFCNGRDDDGDGLTDEGCSDRDADGVVDEMDNCPLVANSKQTDGDGDLRGDSCSVPPAPPDGLTVTEMDDGLRLSWQPVEAAVVVGYNVYRRAVGEGVFRFVGPTWPRTQDTEFVDEAAPGRGATYVVRSVSRHGLESEPSAEVGWGAGSRRLYLPAAQR